MVGLLRLLYKEEVQRREDAKLSSCYQAISCTLQEGCHTATSLKAKVN